MNVRAHPFSPNQTAKLQAARQLVFSLQTELDAAKIAVNKLEMAASCSTWGAPYQSVAPRGSVQNQELLALQLMPAAAVSARKQGRRNEMMMLFE